MTISVGEQWRDGRVSACGTVLKLSSAISRRHIRVESGIDYATEIRRACNSADDCQRRA